MTAPCSWTASTTTITSRPSARRPSTWRRRRALTTPRRWRAPPGSATLGHGGPETAPNPQRSRPGAAVARLFSAQRAPRSALGARQLVGRRSHDPDSRHLAAAPLDADDVADGERRRVGLRHADPAPVLGAPEARPAAVDLHDRHPFRLQPLG